MTYPFHQKGKYGRKSSFKMKIKTLAIVSRVLGHVEQKFEKLTRIKELVEYF